MNRTVRTAFAVLACVLMVSVQAAPAAAEERAGAEAGWGTLAGVTSLLYAPLKVTYAIGGIVIGGIAFALSAGDREVWSAVTTPALRGDYVVTPNMLRGQDSLQFIGRPPEPTYAAPTSYGQPTYP